MNKNLKTGLIIGGITLTILGVAYWFYKIKYKKVDTPDSETDIEDNSTATCTPTFPLAKGSGIGSRICEQPYVELVQNYLNRNDLPIFSLLTIDGRFGSNTESALKRITGKTTVSKNEYDNMKVFVVSELTEEENKTDNTGDFWSIPPLTLFG